MPVYKLEALSRRSEAMAMTNREMLQNSRVLAVQLSGSPGVGKTALLDATLRKMSGRARVAVIIGHPAAARDADRLRHRAESVVAIDATGVQPHDLRSILESLDLDALDMLLLETATDEPVDLGEHLRVALFSVAGGDDKAAEFPHRVEGADLILLNKIDLLPHVKFDPRVFRSDVVRLNSRADLIELSARDDVGIDPWIEWLLQHLEAFQATQPLTPTTSEWWFG